MNKYFAKILSLIFVVLTGCAAVEGLSNRTTYTYQTEQGMGKIYVSEARGECWLQILGDISIDTVRAFGQAAVDFSNRSCESKWVILNSGGGSVLSAMIIGQSIRDHGFNTTLMGDGGFCASACGMIFIGGVKREIKENLLIGSRLGFHQISRKGIDGKPICFQPDAKEYKALLSYTSHLLPVDAASLFVKLASETDCHKISIYSYKQLRDTGIVTGNNGANYRFL